MGFKELDFPPIHVFGHDIPMDSPPWMVLMVTMTMGITILIDKLFDHVHLHIPRKLIAMVLVTIFVIVINYNDITPLIVNTKLSFDPDQFLNLYMPVSVLTSLYSIERKKFLRLLPVSFLISCIPLLGGFMHGFVMKPVHPESWELFDCATFGYIFATMQPFYLMNLLKTTNKFKESIHLLHVSGLLANLWALVTIDYVDLIYDDFFQAWYYVTFTVLRHWLSSLVTGFILGKLATLSLILLVWDATSSCCILLSYMVMGYYFSNLLLFSEFLTMFVMMIVILYDKDRFSSDTEKHIGEFFCFVCVVLDLAIYIYCLCLIMLIIIPFQFKYVYLYAFSYVFVIMIRCLLLLIMYPLLKKVKSSLTLGGVLILSWSNCVGNPALVACLHLYYIERTRFIARSAMPYLVFSSAASSLINNVGLAIILRTININLLTPNMIQSILAKMNILVEERNKYIEVLKMNRRMGDVNWTYVKQLINIKLPPPFPKNLEITGTHKEEVKICCDQCPFDITLSITPKKLLQFRNKINEHLIKEMKAILLRQHEIGLISREVFTALTNNWHSYLDLETDPNKKIALVNKFFKKSTLLEMGRKCSEKGFIINKDVVLKPRTPFRRVCYKIFKYKCFKIITYLAITWCVIEPVVSVLTVDIFEHIAFEVFVFYHILTVFFAVEFFLALMSYSWVYLFRHGCRTYFSALWNILAFMALCLMFVEMDIAYHYYDHYIYFYEDDLEIVYYTRFIRIPRFCQVCIGVFPWFASMLKTQSDLSVAFGYEMAKAMKECYDELLIIIDRVVENSDMRDYFANKITEERLLFFKFILKAQLERTWLSTTVKTRQMINSTRCAMITELQKMKYSGSVEGMEYNQILAAISGKQRGLKTLVKIEPVSGVGVFLSIPWAGDAIGYFFSGHAQVEMIKAEKQICVYGKHTNGIYVLLSGLLKLTYSPKVEVIEQLIKNGLLPVIDYLNTTNVEKKIEEYIIPGNTFGELCFLTSRPYDCVITAETDSKVYLLKKKYLNEFCNRQPDSFVGLECRMWKYATINLAITVLMSSVSYQFYTLREIQTMLERSFVPDLSRYKIFVVTNLMEDIILLKGMVVDFLSRDVYTAPCYLPRSVIKMFVARCSFFNTENFVNTKLMIIPVPDVRIDEIMRKAEKLAEFIPDAIPSFERVQRSKSTNLRE